MSNNDGQQLAHKFSESDEKLTSETASFVFWVHQWEDMPIDVNRLSPRYTLCKITSTYIELHRITPNPDALSIALESIEECQLYGYSPGRAINLFSVHLTLSRVVKNSHPRLRTDSLYLIPIDPLGFLPDDKESDVMIEVINELRKGNMPNIFANPYRRALIRADRSDEFSEGKWDALTPPSEYFPPPGFWGAYKPVFYIAGIFGILYLIGLVFEKLGILPGS